MDAQQTILITSIVVIHPSSNELLPDTSDYRLVVDTSHANAISIQSLATNYSLYSYDVTRIIYDPGLQSFYWHNVRSFIEATLLGYHGMIIFLLSSHIQADNLNVTPFEILFTAVDQIFYCIQSSKCKYTQYFQVLFSHFALSIEDGHLFDLCRGLDAAAYLYRDVNEQQHTLIKTRLIDLNNLKQLIDRNHTQFKSELSHGIEGTHNLAQLGYHEFICMNVGFTGFSASFAPIGGELTFVIISTDYISPQTTQDSTGNGMFVPSFTTKTIDPLSSLLNNIITKKGSNNQLETPLCSLLRDGVGGPCKTCVISLLPEKFGLNATENETSNEHTQLLNIAYQFSLVRNCPNRRIFAEKALMNVYMKEISSNVSEVTKSGEDSDAASQEFGEDTIKQAAIALEQAVLEYNKRIQLTESNNEFELEAFNIADFTTTHNLNLKEQIKSDNEEEIEANYPLEELISEETVLQETKVEQQNTNNNNNNNNNSNSNNNNDNNNNSNNNDKTKSISPLLTNIRITLNTNKSNENAQEINIQLLNTSQPSDSSEAVENSDNINKEHSTKPNDGSVISNRGEYSTLVGEENETHIRDSAYNNSKPQTDAINELFNRVKSLNKPDNVVEPSGGYSPENTEEAVILPFSQDTQAELTSPLESPLFDQIQEKRGDAQIAEVVTFMLQDPMRGAPRCYQARGSKEILQRRDLGSVFTGHAITAWIMNNVNGIQEWDDAESFGQWLLDQGELIHSEGSFVFAGAESLFYYARRSQPSTRNLSIEEIKRLMSEAKKVLQLANTEFYEQGKSFDKSGTVVSKVASTTANDDMILHQLMAEQLVVMKAGSRNVSIEAASLAGRGSNQSQSTADNNRYQYQTSPNNALSGSKGSGKKFLMNRSDSSIDKLDASGASNHVSDLFQTRDVVVENAAISEDIEVIKVVERKKQVLIGNLTEKYVENIVQIFELHPLFQNCRSGCRMGVLRNLVLTFGVNFEDEQKRTAIFYAAAGDQCRIGLELIHSHANINHIDKFELSPLLVATQLGYVSFLKMLLSHGADVTHFDKAGSNAYHLACKLEAIGCLQKLLNKVKPGVLDKLDNLGLSPIHYAIQNNFTGHVELLFKQHIDSTVLDPKGFTYLSFSIYNNSICYITPILKNYPVLIGQANSDLSTALHVAAIQSTSEYLQVLLSVRSLKKHLDINQCDSNGRAALHEACKRGVDGSVRLLLTSNACVLNTDTDGFNPLQYAMANTNITQEVIDLLEATEINEMKGIVKLQEGVSKTCQIQ